MASCLLFPLLWFICTYKMQVSKVDIEILKQCEDLNLSKFVWENLNVNE